MEDERWHTISGMIIMFAAMGSNGQIFSWSKQDEKQPLTGQMPYPDKR